MIFVGLPHILHACTRHSAIMLRPKARQGRCLIKDTCSPSTHRQKLPFILVRRAGGSTEDADELLVDAIDAQLAGWLPGAAVWPLCI